MSPHDEYQQPEVTDQSPAVPRVDVADRTYSYQQKYTRCHKPACRRCADGPGHGPYWYAFWWEAGRTRTRYLGKTAPQAAQTAVEKSAGPPSRATALPHVRVVTLGRFEVWRDDVLLPESAWLRRKSLALFKLLISTPGHRILRDQALDELWPVAASRSAASGFRGATHGIRHALDPAQGASAVQSHGEIVALTAGLTIRIDAEEFEVAAAAALAGRDTDLCRAALAHYGGDYLPDDLYDDWTSRRRDELSDLRIALLLHHARLCAEEGDTAEARSHLSAVLAIDPAHEEAACRQMTLLAAVGEKTEALRVFQRLRDTLRDQYALEPGEEVADLAERLQAQQAARATRRSPAPSRRHTNLPGGLSTFIGRQDAKATVRRLLRESRLVTLGGPGGSGKTRLALRVAELALTAYPDGVWLCELAGLARQAERHSAPAGSEPVSAAVASALGLVEDPGCKLEATICAFLGPRRLLLILDNCEHLVDSVARLVTDILRSCPDVRILVTSQEVLGLPGEATWAVPPLSLPEPGLRCTLERLSTFDGIRLFVERARAARPGFVLSEATAPLVVNICRRLEGIPLAIELAASRMAFLSLDVLAARVDDRFHLLVGGSRIALPRHQTLRAAMDWSYSLLGSKERALLRRLTIFAGGWTLSAAEGICADDELPRESILDTLGGLVAKSLATVREVCEQERYGMLETVREYGHARLGEDEQEAALRVRHVAWFASFCEATIAAWGSTDQATLLRRLDAELENVRAALAWGLGNTGAATEALRLASALSRYWQTRGLVSEGRRWTARALDAAPRAPKALRATALNRCALLARLEADSNAAGRLMEASLALFRELGDAEGIARVAGNLGLVRYDRGDDAGAVESLSEALALKRQHGNQPETPIFLLNLGMVYTRMQRYDDAETALAEACAIWQVAGDQVGLSVAYLNMAQLARDRRQLERAADLYVAGLRISVALGDRPQMSTALEGVAHVLLSHVVGAHDKPALKLCGHLLACAAALRESTGVPVHAADHPQYQADLQQLRALLGPKAFEAEWARGWATPPGSLIERIPGFRRA